jgi:hypothetical protein
MATPPRTDPTCPVCSKPIISGSLVLYQHGEFLHVRCVNRTLGLKAMEEAERAKESQARAAEIQERAARLVEEAKRLRKRPDAAD